MHYSEMNFLFNEPTKIVTTVINNTTDSNSRSIFWRGDKNEYVVYKQNPEKIKENNQLGSTSVKNFIRDNIYNGGNENPYIKLINEFQDSPALRIKPSDLAYLRDLGVYPINRMVILRRFPDGNFVPSDLTSVVSNTFSMLGMLSFNKAAVEPISTVIGWIKPEDGFGDISFNETWDTTTNRFDMLLREIIAKETGGMVNIDSVIPIPGFAQGFLFQLFNYSGLVGGDDSPWNSDNIPIGDPDLLQEGPYRDPTKQNLKSAFNFSFETTYEQKLIGETDPGAAMMDLIDNLTTMGTSNMKFYWSDKSDVIMQAKRAASKNANSATEWWDFIKTLLGAFSEGLTKMMEGIEKKLTNIKETASLTGVTATDKMKDFLNPDTGPLAGFMRSILTSTVGKYRWEMRGTIELMVGGEDSSTPWYLTIGNPYAPWIATNHIKVNNITVSTSNELGYQDQPMWLKAKIDCELSRSLGKQEIMKMFNNTFVRRYSKKQNLFISALQQQKGQKTPTIAGTEIMPGIDQSFSLDVSQIQKPNIKNIDDGTNSRSGGPVVPDTTYPSGLNLG